MGQLGSQVTIVGQQQHTRGVTVQTTNRIDTLRASTLHKVHHRLTLLGIVARGHIVLRLVQQHIDLLLHGDGLLVELHLIGTQHLGTQLGHHLTVHGDNTCLDKLVGLTTAANTGISQELVQTDGLVGIEVLLLVLYALLHVILSIGIEARSVLTVSTGTLLIATALLITATLRAVTALTLLVAAALGSITTLALLVATLTGLIASLVVIPIAGTGLVAAILLAGLISSLVVVAITGTGLIATLLPVLLTGTGLVASLVIIVVTGTGLIATLRGSALQTGAEALRTETALVLILITIVTALLCAVGSWLMNTWAG